VRLISSIVFVLIVQVVLGQSLHVPLSTKHLQKIEKANSAKAKLRLYRKFYSKDSARYMKKYQAKLIRASDSVFLATKIAMSLSENKWEGNAGEVQATIQKPDYNSLMDKYGTAHAQEIKSEYASYSSDLKKYEEQFGKFKQLDSLKNFTAEDAKAMAEKEMKERLPSLVNQGELSQYRKEFDAIKEQQMQYVDQMRQAGDSAYIRQQAKEKAEQLAQEYIMNNPLVMKAAQAKINALMKVYSFVPNSNDLSTAVKRTSLQGRSFKERLVIGGNFQLVSIKPLTLDLLPMIGYKVNTQFVIGMGGAYRIAPGDSINGLAHDSFGYKLFSSYEIFGDFFLYTEFDRNTIGRSSMENGDKLIWQNKWLIGAGKKFSISDKLDMTVLLLYDFFHKPDDPINPRPLVLRMGFQLSDVALLKG
jgi:hypothetical protein